jgi:hypothetical protein
MTNTIDDFMRRFGSGQTVDDQMAAELHERFVSTRPEDSQFENRAYHEAATEYLGKLPDDQFRTAARNAVTQVAPEQRQDLLGGLLGALTGGSGGGLGNIAKTLGLSTTDPNQMSEDDAARVMNYARKEDPDALRQTVQEKPWLVKALGNPVVLGALTLAAAKLLQGQKKTG